MMEFDKLLISNLMLIKHLIAFSTFLFIGFCSFAQDTIKVSTFNYGSTTRDTVIDFPDNGETYERIILKYNMRCKNNLVSDGSDRNKGCGEWDYSCNTYIVDSTKIDSLKSTTNEYVIDGFSGSDFNYSNSPLHNYFRTTNINTAISSALNVDTFKNGIGVYSSSDAIPGGKEAAKSQHLFSAAELSSAGLVAGEINGIVVTAKNSASLENIKVSLGSTADTILKPSNAFSGLHNVFTSAHVFNIGSNKLQFHTPFIWDGSSNLIIEFTSGSNNVISDLLIESSIQTSNNSISAKAGDFITFNGTNYFEATDFNGILGSQNRSCDAWIKTSNVNQEICSWGKNSSGQKWVFRINGDGTIRVEVNGGSVYGKTAVNDNNWHHVSCVLDGTKVSNIKLYVDGELETIGGIADLTINTVADKKVRISRGINDRYFVGDIDEVRIWDKALNSTEIKELVAQGSAPSDLNYGNLKAYYRFNDIDLGLDYSANNVHGSIVGFQNAQSFLPSHIFKDFISQSYRVNIGWLTGDFTLFNDTTYTFDSISHLPNMVRKFRIVPQYNNIKSDIIEEFESNNKWNTDKAQDYFDDFGNLYNSQSIASSGSIEISKLNYMRRWPSALEIMSFVTPYGLFLDLGPDGKTWTFDVTDFAPVLKGKKRIFMSRGGQWQEQMDIQFQFIRGTPSREVLDINQIWPTAYFSANYNQIIDNSVYFPPVEVNISSAIKGIKLRSSITGHGQEGEFIPRKHFISLNNDLIFDRTVWKECADNPVYPQGGTWIYDRAGWCPGMATDVEEYDVYDYLKGEEKLTLDYGVESGSGDSRYIVSNQIVTYGDYNFKLDVAMVDVKNPSKKVEHARTNPMCSGPIIVAQNNGSELVTSIKVDYWVNDNSNKRTATWQCHLFPGKKEDIYLPIDNSIWSSASPDGSTFYAEVVEVNNQTDEYSNNDLYASPFDYTPTFPKHIYLMMRSNSASQETSMKIENEWGDVVYERTDFAPNQLYRDTVLLGLGCHTYTVEDSDDDGLDFFANNDGAGFIRLMQVGGGVLQSIESDFGKRSVLNFTVNHALSTPKELSLGYKCYPNPTANMLTLEGFDLQNAKIELINSLGQDLYLVSKRTDTKVLFDVSDQPIGVYFVSVLKNGLLWTSKVIVQ